MKRYQNRLINLSYDPDALQTFPSNTHSEAFIKALGYAVLYQLSNSHPDGAAQLVNLSIDKEREITAVYWPFALKPEADATGYSRYTGSTNYIIDNAVKALRELSTQQNPGRSPFVMGGVPRDGGITYSFHS